MSFHRVRPGRALLAFSTLLAAGSAGAIEVTTVTLDTPIHLDGVAFDGDRTLYAATGWDRPQVYAVDVQTGAVSIVATGQQGPIDVHLTADGDLLSTNWTGTTIARHDLDGGSSSVYATPGVRMDGLATDPDGDVWVTRGWFDQIYRVSPGGTVTPIPVGPMDYPLGITLGGDGHMYVGASGSGIVHRVDPDGTVTDVATVPGDDPTFRIGHLTWARGKLYATGLFDHMVYEISLDGTVIAWGVDDGAGATVDGDETTVRFDTPIGIDASPDGRYLYVAQLDGVLRVIDLGPSVAVDHGGVIVPPDFEIAPNPFRAGTRLFLDRAGAGPVRVAIYAADGREVRVLHDGVAPAGRLTLAWDGTARGRALPAGVYFARVSGPDRATSNRRIVLHR